jgi:exodeoxyribonuclease V alpha subunit
MDYKQKTARVKLDRNGVIVKVAREDMELAHALTVHKTQGSEYDVVILVLLDVPRMLANRELLYTAVTRAKRKLYVVSDEVTIGLCMRQQISTRKCKLAEYLDACLDI